MKKNIIFVLFVVISGLFLQSCNRNASLSSAGKMSSASYDTTAFDYVYTEALKQKFLGNPGDAMKFLEQALKINPLSDAAYYEMAQISFMMSDQKNGKKFALKAASINERNIWYLIFVANIYYQEKDLDSAILFYEKAVKYFPEKEDIRLNLAGVYSEKGNNEKAEVIYSYLEEKYGINESTSLSMIKSLMNTGDFKKAEEKTLALLKKYPDVLLYNGILAEIYRSSGQKEKAIDVYNNLLEKDPGNPQTLVSLSQFLREEKDYEDLFLILNRIVLSDSIKSEDKINLFVQAIEDSSLVRARGSDLELILMVLEATKMDDYIIILLRPELYQKQNNFQEAIARLEEIITLQTENYFAWEKLLILYSEAGEWNKLYITGKECATRFNRSFLAKILYASAALEKEELSVAEEELRKARILAGSDTDSQVQVLVMEADLFYKKREFKKSYEVFQEALKLKPGDLMILNNYAYYLAEQGEDLKEAERMARIVIDNESNNTTYLDTYAWVLYKRGRFKEAQKIMEQVIGRGEKQNAEWYDHLGYIMKAQDKCIKAIEYWKEAIRLDSRKISLQKQIENCGKL
jgi:tetratricopeptide (TPR) repeat protein